MSKQKLRKELWNAQMGECYYCTRRVNNADHGTLDHKTPKSKGGSGEKSNLVFACVKCNAHKAHMDHYAFVRMMLLDAHRILKSRAVKSFLTQRNSTPE
jgi:5-methylcytosine-specific restriction endonuclease McrA